MIQKFYCTIILLTILATIYSCSEEKATQDNRPNILLIVADDAGYSDFGCYGSEINTPNIDKLADDGIQFTQFCVTPNCAPTRSSILSGIDHHLSGLGTMKEVASENQIGKPGYEGYLNFNVATLPEVLKSNGYHTYMTGKWHLGSNDPKTYPDARGFVESFALLNGGASHWSDNKPLIPGKPSVYTDNGKIVKELPSDFYSTKFYTDQMINYIDKNKDDAKPFFGYLSYTAPHNPLHAPKEYIEKYKGKYDLGWDKLAADRLNKLKELGIISKEIKGFSRPDWIMAWDNLTDKQKKERARDMEVYAAMIDYLDESIGRVIEYLQKNNLYKNTLVVLISDNGASKTMLSDYAALGGEVADYLNSFDNSIENRGLPNSAIDIGPGWAYSSNSPFRLTKGFVSQGGIQVPAIFKFPSGEKDYEKTINTFANVTDLMPTFLDIVNIDGAKYIDEKQLLPIQGHSLLNLISGNQDKFFENREQGFELYGMRAYRKGDWKALMLPEPYGNGNWQLFNLKTDPSESIDLSDKYPELVSELAKEWEKYSLSVGVIEPNKRVGYAKAPKPNSF
jgi:arylsulfatase A-like enzyme